MNCASEFYQNDVTLCHKCILNHQRAWTQWLQWPWSWQWPWDPDIYEETITSTLKHFSQGGATALQKADLSFRGLHFLQVRYGSSCCVLGSTPMTVQLSSWPRNCVQTPDPSALSSRDLNGMQMVCSQNYIKLQRISKATGRHTCVPRVGERKLNRGQMEWERWSQMFLLSRSDLVNKLGWWRALGGLGSVGSGLEVGGLSPCSSASKM